MYSTSTELLTITGIDPGTTNMGYAWIEFDPRTFKITRCGAHTLNAYTSFKQSLYHPVERQTDLTPTQRIDCLTKSLMRHLKEREGVFVTAIENPFFSRRKPTAFGPLLAQVDHIKSEISQALPDILLIGYSPMTIKSASGAKSMKGKEPMTVALLSNPELMANIVNHFDSLTEHAIDALGCAFTYLQQLRKSYDHNKGK